MLFTANKASNAECSVVIALNYSTPYVHITPNYSTPVFTSPRWTLIPLEPFVHITRETCGVEGVFLTTDSM